MRAALAAGMAVLFLSGGRALRAGPVPDPREDIVLSLTDRVIRDISSAGLTLSFRIAVGNRAATDRALVRYRYRVVVNEKEFLNLTVGLDEPLTVPAGRETLISLPVKITYALLTAAVGPVETSGQCEVTGEMVFADERKREDKVGFAFPGEFPVFKDPEVEILPLKVNDLTVGGADLVFRVRFRNPNGYELVISRSTAGIDVATLYDSSGNDRFTAQAARWAQMVGPANGQRGPGSVLLHGRGFPFVFGRASGGYNASLSLRLAGGTCTRGGPAPRPSPVRARTSTAPEAFDAVFATASQDYDVATLYDPAAADLLMTQPMVSTLSSPGYYQRVAAFDMVLAISTQGADKALMLDSRGNDRFTGRPSKAA